MNTRTLAIVFLGEERDWCKTMFGKISLGCTQQGIKTADYVITAMIPYTINQLDQVLKYGNDPKFIEYFTKAEQRLIIALDTKAHDFLDILESAIKTSGLPNSDTVKLLRFSEVVTDVCKEQNINNICVQRTPTVTTTDLLLEQHLAEQGIMTYQFPGGVSKELQRLRENAIQHEHNRQTDDSIFDEFWNAWHVLLANSNVQMILLDNCDFPSSKTRPPYMNDLRVTSTCDLYVKAITKWIRQHVTPC